MSERIRQGGRRVCVGLLVAAWFAAPELMAQGAEPQGSRVPDAAGAAVLSAPPPRPPGDGKETEAQTIARCLVDLESADAKVRHRAVLVIGKYVQPPARLAVIRMLNDTDDAVRQAALVSLLEGEAIIPAARLPAARLLADKNVQIRRLASAACRELFMSAFMFMDAGDDGPVRLSGGAGAGGLPPDILAIVNHALLDEDPIVRKNVLTYAMYFQGSLDAAALKQNLAHPDKEIRVLALRALGQAARLKPTELLALLTPLANDPESVVREEVARFLGNVGPAGTALLRKLAGDSDAGVKIGALEGLCRMHDPQVLDALVAVMKDESIPVAGKKRLLWNLSAYGEAGMRKALELMQNTPVAVQVEALRLLSGFPNAGLKADFFLPYLENASRELRSTAAGALVRYQQELTPAQIRTLCGSPFPEVRHTGLQFCLRLPAPEAANQIGDALLDDDVEVRCIAIMYANHLKIPDWLTVLTQSLLDADMQVQRAGADALLSNVDPASRAAVSEFAAKHPEAPVTAYLRARQEELSGRAPVPAAPGARGSIRSVSPAVRRVPGSPPAVTRPVPAAP